MYLLVVFLHLSGGVRSPTKIFHAQCGLQQNIPLLPLFFIVVLDFLSCRLVEAVMMDYYHYTKWEVTLK